MSVDGRYDFKARHSNKKGTTKEKQVRFLT